MLVQTSHYCVSKYMRKTLTFVFLLSIITSVIYANDVLDKIKEIDNQMFQGTLESELVRGKSAQFKKTLVYTKNGMYKEERIWYPNTPKMSKTISYFDNKDLIKVEASRNNNTSYTDGTSKIEKEADNLASIPNCLSFFNG